MRNLVKNVLVLEEESKEANVQPVVATAHDTQQGLHELMIKVYNKVHDRILTDTFRFKDLKFFRKLFNRAIY